MKKLRIGLATEWFAPETGGGETHILELAEWLAEQGHEVHFLLGDRVYRKFMRHGPRRFPFQVHRVRMPPRYFLPVGRGSRQRVRPTGWAYIAETLMLNAEAIYRLRLDVLHGHSHTMYNLCIVLGRLLGIPSIATMHLNFLTLPSLYCSRFCEGYDVPKCLACRRFRLPWLARQKDKIWDLGLREVFASNAGRLLTLSSNLKSSVAKYSGLDRNVTVVPNWVRPERFALPKKSPALLRKYGLPRDEKILLYVGRIYWLKGMEYLVEALPAILAQHPGCRLVIAGRVERRFRGLDNYDRKVRNLIRRHKLADRVVYTGNIDWKDMPEIYSLADVLVHPSLSETQGLVLLEAMAAKVPVVTTSLKTIGEFIADGKNGLLVKPRDARALGRAVIRILDDRRLRGKLVRNAHRTVRERFAASKVLPRLLKVYREEIEALS
jgi:glycosyltransferase involved in cell wall biosynthesis